MIKFIQFIGLFFIVNYSITVHAEEDTLLNNYIKDLYNCSSKIKEQRIIKKILKASYHFDTIYSHIKKCDYFSDKKSKTGYMEWTYTLDSIEYCALVFIPNNYNPQKKYELSVILHGAVGNLNPFSVKNYIKPNSYNLDSINSIVVYPNGWFMSKWWDEKQVKNLAYLLKKIKENYNINENRIYLSGISDGGTGIIYQANLNITPWANFRPYISNPGGVYRLGEKNTYLKNFGNRPFLFISTDRDQTFPHDMVESFLEKMTLAGNTYQYFLAHGYKHEISWLPLYQDAIQNFIQSNPRDPYPSSIYWQTNDILYNRNHCVIINKLSNKEKIDLKKYPEIKTSKESYQEESGIIEVQIANNQIDVHTINIKQYTLLLSPEQFNFNKEIKVYTNGKLSFQGTIEKDISTLLKWFKKDLDRTMLFGARLQIKP